MEGKWHQILTAELRSPGWMYLKAGLFLLGALMSGGLILLAAPRLDVLLLLGLLAWCSCRCYYFLFYVLEQYVDPSLRYAGIVAQLRQLWRRMTRGV